MEFSPGTWPAKAVWALGDQSLASNADHQAYLLIFLEFLTYDASTSQDLASASMSGTNLSSGLARRHWGVLHGRGTQLLLTSKIPEINSQAETALLGSWVAGPQPVAEFGNHKHVQLQRDSRALAVHVFEGSTSFGLES